MLRILCSLLLLFPAMLGAQVLPYTRVITLQDIAESLDKVDGVSCDLRVEHTRPDDRRKFRMFLKSPQGETEIKVFESGVFHVPKLPREDWKVSKVRHTLEKGALSLKFRYGFNGGLPSTNATLYELCQSVAEKWKNIETFKDKLLQAIPEFKEVQIALIGLWMPQGEPCDGKIFLKRGDETVAVIDLSKPAETTWLFEQYDPKLHRVVWDVKDREKAPAFNMRMQVYNWDQVPAKNSFILWPRGPNGPTNITAVAAINLDRR
jgi:hypothetical protein